MRVYKLTPSDLVREVITLTGMKREEIIKELVKRGSSHTAAESTLSKAINGLGNVTAIGSYDAVLKVLGVKSWGVKGEEFFADLPGRVPGSGRKRRTPDRIYNEVLANYARELRNGGVLLKRRELAKLCGVSLPVFNRWLAQQDRFVFKGEKNGTRIWDTAE
ncbi:TPA: hypothetical protein SI347_004720 [Escherichia coli]|nr:hypothetical protein [Escherichia coli]